MKYYRASVVHYAVALVSVVVGIALAVWQFVGAELPAAPPRGLVDMALFEACVTFYSVTYCTGRIVYLFMGRNNDARTIQQGQHWHMLLLHSMGLICVIALIDWKNWIHVIFQPVVVAMALATLMSAIDFFFGARDLISRNRELEDEANSNE